MTVILSQRYSVTPTEIKRHIDHICFGSRVSFGAVISVNAHYPQSIKQTRSVRGHNIRWLNKATFYAQIIRNKINERYKMSPALLQEPDAEFIQLHTNSKTQRHFPGLCCGCWLHLSSASTKSTWKLWHSTALVVSLDVSFGSRAALWKTLVNVC